MSPANPPLGRAIRILAAIAALTAVCLGIVAERSRKASRQASNDMRMILRAQAPVLDQASKHERQRDTALGKDLAVISRTEHSAQKPTDIAKRLASAFPPLPHPLAVSLPHAVDVPDSPAIIAVPQDDLKPLFDRLEDCRACQEELANAQQDLEDERAKVSALTIERDAALKAARGGGFWSRVRTGAKWFAIGGVMGALAASAARR